MRPVFRFAPTPNGHLHLGHALSALLNAELAARCGGVFIVRIEDIDRTRCKAEYEDAIFEDLAWLGLTWETPVRRQSDHFNAYREAVSKLAAQGLVYRSFESRGDIARVVAASSSPDAWPRDPDGAPLFPGAALHPDDEARLVAEGAPFAWRLDMDKALARTGPLTWTERGHAHETGQGLVEAEPEAWGDVVLAGKDKPTSYHLSVVIDDALQGVTDIVRGADLHPSTAVHRVLQTLLDLPQPHYSHHPLILGDDGRKLSKSAGSPALRDLRAQGATPGDIRRILGLG
jgi:glutamyl-Q tRNA(Asp) synthetase